MLHLLHDRWIPVRCQSGRERLITPHEITDTGDTPVQILGSRSDLHGSYIQFLIGLIQTVFPPESDRDWRGKMSKPPDGSELKERFSPFDPYFQVIDGEIRFMQDPGVEGGEKIPIGRILLEMPGENAEKNNTDHFLKRGTVSQICPRCAAIALYTLQTNASFGGAGHRVGLRGGGPMTTLIKGKTVWEQVWLNVLERQELDRLGNSSLQGPDHQFPWSKHGLSLVGTKVTPRDVHPCQMFWGMPRRIFLYPEEVVDECDLCGASSPVLVHSYATEKNGIQYTGGWQHTLSPHFIDKKTEVPGAIHVQPGGITYKNWLGVMQTSEESKGKTKPARVVEKYLSSRRRVLDDRSVNPPVWAFGYDMDKAKARCYYESFLPTPLVSQDCTEEFELVISQWINASSYVLWAVKQTVKQAWYETPKNHPGDIPVLSLRFWAETETPFYEHMGKYVSICDKSPDPVQINKEWLSVLQRTAFRLFDEYSQRDMIGVADPKRIVLARRSLAMLTSPGTKKVALILGLPLPEKKRVRASG